MVNANVDSEKSHQCLAWIDLCGKIWALTELSSDATSSVSRDQKIIHLTIWTILQGWPSFFEHAFKLKLQQDQEGELDVQIKSGSES